MATKHKKRHSNSTIAAKKRANAEAIADQKDRALGDWWWLRTPGSNLFSAVAVYDDGSLYEFGIHVHYENGGVRPVVWVLLK